MIKLFPALRFKEAKILVVDDAVLNIKLISAKLQASGYTNIESAENGKEGVELTHKFKPDVVLLDIMMPVMDGYGYMQHIRADSSFMNMPIIVQTAMEDRQTKLKALGSGADDFLNKPLDLEELALRVHIHLERHFILQDMEALRGQLGNELQQANETITRLESKIPQSDRGLLTKHYDAMRNIAFPLGDKKVKIS